MTHVIERLTVRNSVDLLDAIGKPVTSSVTMHVKGGGLFHALIVGGTTAVYWGRNENKFLTLELGRRDLDNADREWGNPQGRTSNVIAPHNIMCSCSECLQRQLQPTHAMPGAVEPVQLDLPPTPEDGATAAWPNTERTTLEMQIADNALAVSALAERVRVLEAEVNALRAKLDARNGQ